VPWAEEATPLAALATSRVGDDRLQAAPINRGPRLMTLTPDADLYLRGAATLVASWRAYARGSAGAALMRLDGVSAAVFPSDPERAVYNNALERTGGNTGGIRLGGILVIVGIVLMIVWSFWIGLIIALVGLIAFGGFAKGKWY